MFKNDLLTTNIWFVTQIGTIEIFNGKYFSMRGWKFKWTPETRTFSRKSIKDTQIVAGYTLQELYEISKIKLN